MLTKYKVGDVLQFGDGWLLILNLPDSPNVTIGREELFLGRYNPLTDRDIPLDDNKVLFNIFDIKKRIEEDGH